MNYWNTSIKALQQRTRTKEGSENTKGETREIMMQREHESLTMSLRLKNNSRFCLRPRASTKNRAIIAASVFIFMVLMVFQNDTESRALTNYIGGPEGPAWDSTIKEWTRLWDGILLGSDESSPGQQQTIEDATSGQALMLSPPPSNLDMQKLQSGDVSDLSVLELFEIFPPPSHPKTIQIYDEKAYLELVQSFRLNEKFTICASGGSSTAGGGHIPLKNRFFTLLDKHLRSLDAFGDSASEVIGRAHGGRTSMHTAVFAPNLLPPDVDLMIWEFAINDYPYSPLIPGWSHADQTQGMLLAWLREVERISPNPPKVILVYLWKTPFQLNGDGMVNNPVYDMHANLAREFDFVVGHVNLASYFDNELEDIDFGTKRALFLADQHHISNAGHVATSFLLLTLLRGQGEWVAPNDNAVERILPELEDHGHTNYTWQCGEETEEKRFLKSLITEEDRDLAPGWRSPLGTMTLELPRNDDVVAPHPRALIMYDFKEASIETLGKQDPARNDRKRSISLPCCKSDPNMYITLKTPYDSKPMLGARAIFLAFAIGAGNVSDVKVYINAENTFVPGNLLHEDTRSMPCFWNWKDQFDTRWFAFSDEIESISSLSLCVENDQCQWDATSGAMMIATAIY
jgi:hypothetical protein